MSDRRDAVIFEYATRRVDAIAGRDLRQTGPRNSVESRIETVLPRLNERYGVCDVPPGKYNVGDILEDDE